MYLLGQTENFASFYHKIVVVENIICVVLTLVLR